LRSSLFEEIAFKEIAMMHRVVTFVAAVAALPAVVQAGPVSGIVRTATRSGIAPATAVIYAEALDAAPRRATTSASLVQKNKAFQPHILAVPIGSTVSFPNEDGIFHNVFSLSAPQPFDLGLYRSGEIRTRTFTSPGTYRVFCNIHPQMTALVIVVSTPHITTAGADGRFALTLPPGRYRLTAVSERAGPVSVEVTSVAGAATAPELTLDESAWAQVQHKNKYGQEYPAAAYTK
jgi:plastocyanin